jgi:hypothetical protein
MGLKVSPQRGQQVTPANPAIACSMSANAAWRPVPSRSPLGQRRSRPRAGVVSCPWQTGRALKRSLLSNNRLRLQYVSQRTLS